MSGAPDITVTPDATAAPNQRGWNRSRTIGLLKVLLPTVALSLVALVVVWAQQRNSDGGFRIGFSLVKPEDARTLSMVNARYAGLNKGRQPYLVTARIAVQNKPGADLIHLTEPKGDITTKSGAWVALTAPKGEYRQQQELLDLMNGATLFHDSGLEFNTPTAQINLKDSTAIGFDPVIGQGPSAHIKSKGFRVLDQGTRVIFTGKAYLTLYRASKTLKGSASRRPK
ncbi:MAG: lipopolysaccharide export system protein LptC [Alphaproteobacteria bacterium]|jgi:lipopolysaccharide export system protein LptC